MFYIGEHLSFIHQNLNEGLILANSWKILLAERKISRYFQGGGGWSVAYLLLGKVICLWHIINIPPKTTTCDKTKDSLRRLKVNFKKIFKLLLRILLHQTVQLELSNLDNRLQFSFWLGTSYRKTCNLPSSIDIVRFWFLSESYNKFRLISLHLIHWFSIIQNIQEKIFCKSNDGDASK